LGQGYIPRHNIPFLFPDIDPKLPDGKIPEIHLFYDRSCNYSGACHFSAEWGVIFRREFHINRSEIMFEKFAGKENFIKLITVLLIASIGILALSILTENSDGRKQIIDGDGASEEQLCSVLSSIKGAGDVEVMVQYNDDYSVAGVIVIAEGGADPVTANALTNGVATLYNIPVSSVIVFEKEQEE
jgi:hypothetical protein